jgi:hypothetical protein
MGSERVVEQGVHCCGGIYKKAIRRRALEGAMVSADPRGAMASADPRGARWQVLTHGGAMASTGDGARASAGDGARWQVPAMGRDGKRR